MAFVANALQSDVDTSKRAANVPMTSSAGYATGGRGKRTANSGKGKKALDSSDRTIQWVNQREVSPRIPIGVNCDTSEELYQAILSGFSDWKASRSSDVDQKHLVEGIATKLNLFGADYQDGLLSQILLQADELRDTVLGLLIRISSTFCNDLIGKDRREGFREHARNMKELTDKATLLTSFLKPVPDDDFMSPFNSDDDEDPLEIIQDFTNGLMDLVPSLEEIYARLHLPKIKSSTTSVPNFSVSQSALPFVQNISEEFQKAEKYLVERLGEANWQRFVRIRAWRDAAIPHDAPASNMFDDGTVPKSLFEPPSLYRDSALGSSIAIKEIDSVSVVSHTSFASSIIEDSQALRVPKTPAAVALAQPFVCDICGRFQKGIRNRIDWKIHVFEDLRPYICTMKSCDNYLSTFESRSQWADHEFTEHRTTKTWNCPTCSFTTFEADSLSKHIRKNHHEIKESSISTIVSVCVRSQSASAEDQICYLCLEQPGHSRRKFVKHVARHLEAIALAALPRETDNDSDSGFEDKDTDSSDAGVAHAPRELQFSSMEPAKASSAENKEPTNDDFDSLMRFVMDDQLQQTISSSTLPVYEEVTETLDDVSDVRQIDVSSERLRTRDSEIIPPKTSEELSIKDYEVIYGNEGYQPYICQAPGCESIRRFAHLAGLLRHTREVHGRDCTPVNYDLKLSPSCQHPDCNSSSFSCKKELEDYLSVTQRSLEPRRLFCPHKDCKRSNSLGFSREVDIVEHMRRIHRGVGFFGGEGELTSPELSPPADASISDQIQTREPTKKQMSSNKTQLPSVMFCPHKDCERNTRDGFLRKDNLQAHIHRVHHGIGIVKDESKIKHPELPRPTETSKLDQKQGERSRYKQISNYMHPFVDNGRRRRIR